MKKIRRKKILLFPYSGGNLLCYKNLTALLPPNTDFEVLNYRERPEPNFFFTVKDLSTKLKKESRLYDEIILFGHSLGAYFAYELCSLPEFKNLKIKTVLSGACSPKSIKENNFFYSKKDLLDFIELIQGFPDTAKLEQRKKLVDYLFPTMLYDFSMLKQYRFLAENKEYDTNRELTVLFGSRDKIVDRNQINEWKFYSKGDVDIEEFEGNHFFLNENPSRVAKLIVR